MNKLRFGLLCCTALVLATETLAMGGGGSSRRAKATNSTGLLAITAYTCATGDCSQANIKIVSKSMSPYAQLKNGIWRCQDGYIGDGNTCTPENCSEGQKPDSDNRKCINCTNGESCSCTDSKVWSIDENTCITEDRYKAHEILNAALERATSVSTQIQNGSSTPSLAEFGTAEVQGATFDESVTYTSGDTTFALTLYWNDQ